MPALPLGGLQGWRQGTSNVFCVAVFFNMENPKNALVLGGALVLAPLDFAAALRGTQQRRWTMSYLGGAQNI